MISLEKIEKYFGWSDRHPNRIRKVERMLQEALEGLRQSALATSLDSPGGMEKLKIITDTVDRIVVILEEPK